MSKAKPEAKTHYTHPEDKKSPTYVATATGTRLVYPGETVQLAAAQIVTDEAAVGASTDAAGELALLQQLKVADIELKLPELDVDQLTELLKLEQAAKQPRTTLVTKIEEAILAKKAK